MIDAWDIYWIFQIDGIKAMAIGIIGTYTTLYVIFGTIYLIEATEDNILSIKDVLCFKKNIALVCLLSLLFMTTSFIPNGKALAAMYVIPAVANSEEVKGEVKEVYELAKQAMKELVQPDEKDESDE